jgi:hypothetical protein
MSSSYREGSGGLLPLPGARIHALGNAGSGPVVGSMMIWMGAIGVAVGLAFVLDGRIPEEAMPFIAPPIVIAGLIGSVVYYQRSLLGGTWRLHHAAERMVLERVAPPLAFDLDDAQLAIGRYEYQTRGGRGAIPTVTITATGAAPVLLTGPIGVGWQNLGEDEILAQISGEPAPAAVPKSGSPHVRLEDAAAFAALQAKARGR